MQGTQVGVPCALAAVLSRPRLRFGDRDGERACRAIRDNLVIGGRYTGGLPTAFGMALVPLAALAVYGMRAYHPTQFEAWQSYVWSLVGAFLVLALAEWVARLVSLYTSGPSR